MAAHGNRAAQEKSVEFDIQKHSDAQIKKSEETTAQILNSIRNGKINTIEDITTFNGVNTISSVNLLSVVTALKQTLNNNLLPQQNKNKGD